MLDDYVFYREFSTNLMQQNFDLRLKPGASGRGMAKNKLTLGAFELSNPDASALEARRTPATGVVDAQ